LQQFSLLFFLFHIDLNIYLSDWKSPWAPINIIMVIMATTTTTTMMDPMSLPPTPTHSPT